MSQERPKDERRRPLVSVEFQTEVDISTAIPERRMFLKMYFDARDSGLLAAIGDRRWRTLCTLATYMDEKGLCYPSQSRIANDLGIHRQRVNERIKELLEFTFQGRPIITVQKARLMTSNGGRWANNVYQILPVTGLHIFGDESAGEETVAPESPAKEGSSPYVRKAGHRPMSGKPDTGNADTNQIQSINQKVVNALPGSDLKKSSERKSRKPSISDRALRAKYGFTDELIARVHYLVEKQTALLGSADRNHAHYVKRAAEAVAGGDDQLLDWTLGDFKQAATTIEVKSPPSFFHAMWVEALQKRHGGPRAAETEEPTQSSDPHLIEPLSAALASKMTPSTDDVGMKIQRILDDAATRGFAIPENIRRSSHYPTVARWWAELPAHAGRKATGGAP